MNLAGKREAERKEQSEELSGTENRRISVGGHDSALNEGRMEALAIEM
ncbi:MAG: hypothetical protein UY92_C0021G0016 [Candidatus Magasanikbacteria bacterium GW2011_GWA2_56_11]|uniref:Uncharacterized protein n=1 Tax=Candidatus Magasanikbacteria bacterium GW2011_GWA2_56_11 TaxID=1619044 RepID=A0A0G2AJH4_9BACT|nr:MAG: hypothetical protein UY92_C0021G0016 [Candidatus Magasanikbacteria bacterium GW2011_GWA2_56_11]